METERVAGPAAGGSWSPDSGRRGRPVLTGAAFAVAVVAAIAQYAVPSMTTAFERDHGALADGEWWRLLTPILVQTLGWHQVLANLVTLVAVGLVAEHLVGRWRWLVLFAAGTAAGQVAAYVQREPGGGSSIAICGFAGGVLVALLLSPSPASRLATRIPVFYVVALTGWGFGGILAAGLGCVVVAMTLYELDRLELPGSDRLALAGAAVCVVALVIVGDIHGIPLAAGGLAMLVLRCVVDARTRKAVVDPGTAGGML